MATTKIKRQQVGAATLTDAEEAAANIDGASATASLRTLGTGSGQACAGNDSRLSDARTPVGTALTSGSLWLGNGSNLAAAVTGRDAIDAINVRGTIASAGTTDLSTVGPVVNITGTTTITGLGTVADGALRFVRFTGSLTLTHNATSLILPGAANIVTSANDSAIFESLGSGNWICLNFYHAVTPWNGQLVLLASATASASATVDFTWPAGQTYQEMLIVMSDVVPATNSVSLQARTSSDGTTWDSGANNYTWTNMDYSVGSFSGTDTKMRIAGTTTALVTTANNNVSGEFRVFNPGGSVFGKCAWNLTAISGGQSRLQSGGGNRASAAVVRGVQFLMSSGNIASGDFRLYGITRS